MKHLRRQLDYWEYS